MGWGVGGVSVMGKREHVDSWRLNRVACGKSTRCWRSSIKTRVRETNVDKATARGKINGPRCHSICGCSRVLMNRYKLLCRLRNV